MTRPLISPVLRSVVYLYFAGGATLLIGYVIGMDSVLRFQADKRFPAAFLVGVFAGILGLLTFTSWDNFRRPPSPRNWTVLFILSSLGFVALLFAPPFGGGSGA